MKSKQDWFQVLENCAEHVSYNQCLDSEPELVDITIEENSYGRPVVSFCNMDNPGYDLSFELILLGFAGKAGSGKDTARTEYTKHLMDAGKKTCPISFADTLKSICAVLTGSDLANFNDAELKTKTNPVFDMTNRKIAQTVGTECFRDIFGEDVWAITVLQNALQAMLVDFYYTENDEENVIPFYVLIADTRFANEANMIRQLGGQVVMVDREGHSNPAEVDSHRSEQLFPTEENDIVVQNTGSLENFQKSIKTLYDYLNVVLYQPR